MRQSDEDYAFETRRQRELDGGNYGKNQMTEEVKIGSCSGCHRPDRFSNTDKWKDIPFVDDDQQPPSDGLLVLWGVCTTLVLLLSSYLIWGPK